MKKLLLIMLGAGMLAACSSTDQPQPNSNQVYTDCKEAKALVKSNNQKINLAFANRDANSIGTYELENRDIVHANMACFPNVKKQIEYWEKMRKDMTN